jgi:PIN domain nuclease of toxin-antitoxin system
VRLLLDTHLLVWLISDDPQLSSVARTLIDDLDNQPVFSTASLWELAIKSSMPRKDLVVDPRLLRRELLDNGYEELSIISDHTIAVSGLPPIHKDPFDRLLVAQSIVEGITLLTSDSMVAQYPCPVRLV